MEKEVIRIEDLAVSFILDSGEARAVRGINLSVMEGEIHSLVGESGSGKTVTSTCIMGLLPEPPAKVKSGRILFKGENLLEMNEAERRSTRGKEISMVFQEPSRYLNPAFRVGEQITEMLRLHFRMEKTAAVEKALDILEVVGLGRDARVLSSFPHELSGGMKQRVMIAIAVCCNPSLLIADEPTTALDVTLQLQILKLIMELRKRLSMGILFISHDLSIVNHISDRVSVIYAGKIVETGTRSQIFENPMHPYTRLLLSSVPDSRKRGQRLRTILGKVPNAEAVPPGCAFHPRCPLADDNCMNQEPESIEHEANHFIACFYAGKQWKDM